MNQKIDVFEYTGEILKQLKIGALVTVKQNNRVNSMTISWGQIGIEWNKLIFTTFIRNSRFTHDMLIQSGEFTVNFPVDKSAKEILSFCGSESGRDFDKTKELKLNLVDGLNIETPGIKELPLTLECKLIYKQQQNLDLLPAHLREQFYPNDELEGKVEGHTVFYGEVVGAYIAK